MVTKLTSKTRDELRRLRDAPQTPGHGQVHVPNEPGRRIPVVLGKVSTPIVPIDTIGGDHSQAGQFELVRNKSQHPIEDTDAQKAITAISGADVGIAGDYSNVMVAGTRLAIDGSTGNDGWHEVDSVSYDSNADVTTVTMTKTLPDSTTDGLLCMPSGWTPEASSVVRQASAHSSVAAFANDFVAFAEVNGEFVPIAGPQIIFGYLKASLSAPTVVANVLNTTSAKIRVFAFDSDGDWVDTGIERTVVSVWESVTVAVDTLVTAQRMSNRWVITAVGCSASDLTFV